jgi:hypothetical protein
MWRSKPLVMMLVCPFQVVALPPVAIVPVMMFVEIPAGEPIRMMLAYPVGMVIAPPAGIMPGMMLIVVTQCVMFVGVNTCRYCREYSRD